MKRHASATVLALIPFCFALACGPIVMLPGGELSGTPTPVPNDWSFSDEVDVVQLETNPDDPYSVNIWGVAFNGAFYVAGARDSQWQQNMNSDPRVRLKIGDAIYELRAEQANDEADVEALLAALEQKYDFEPDPEERDVAQAYRLVAR